MTAKGMMPAVGHTALIRYHDLEIGVKIHDVKHVYGNTRLYVSPLSGNGFIWVNADRVTAISDYPVDVTVTTQPAEHTTMQDDLIKAKYRQLDAEIAAGRKGTR